MLINAYQVLLNARPYALSQRQDCPEGCGVDFATFRGGGAGQVGEFIGVMCWPLAGPWDGSHVWVKLRNPVALQWQKFLKGPTLPLVTYICLANVEPAPTTTGSS